MLVVGMLLGEFLCACGFVLRVCRLYSLFIRFVYMLVVYVWGWAAVLLAGVLHSISTSGWFVER